MDLNPRKLLENPLEVTGASDSPDRGRATALVTGSVAVGALLTGAVYRMLHHSNLPTPEEVPPALDAPAVDMEMMEGYARFYHREGVGVPLVLLHSLNAAASSHEMRPIFDHFARTTDRPIYALDWLGFGVSDRPPVRYLPDLYQRQLRRFLSEYVHQPADVIALSLGCEYAATVAHALPYLVRHLALVSPTGLSRARGRSSVQRALVSMASSLGAFEIFYYRLTRPESLRRFYQRQVFGDGATVPEDLVDYASVTTRVTGAHYAPRYFVEGSLFTGDEARHAYTHLRIPTLIVTPESSDGLVQDFEGLPEVISENPDFLTWTRLRTGLMPHWDAIDRLVEHLDPFLADGA